MPTKDVAPETIEFAPLWAIDGIINLSPVRNMLDP